VLAASGPGADAELQREQVETGTRPCGTLDELAAELRSTREAAAAAAAEVGVALAPLATSPLAVEPTLSQSRRYEEVARRFGLTVSEELTCGCHVHAGCWPPSCSAAPGRPGSAPSSAARATSPPWSARPSPDSGFCGRARSRVRPVSHAATAGEKVGVAAGLGEPRTGVDVRPPLPAARPPGARSGRGSRRTRPQ
jgi:carboxylate-amine ligase